jgi:hypothetical protein
MVVHPRSQPEVSNLDFSFTFPFIFFEVFTREVAESIQLSFPESFQATSAAGAPGNSTPRPC